MKRIQNSKQKTLKTSLIWYAAPVTLIILLLFCSFNPAHSQWLKGHLHTHSLWSDGDEFPENIAKWYKENGYHFIAFTEGNTILKGNRWRNLPENNAVYTGYQRSFGNNWVEMKPLQEEKLLLLTLNVLNSFQFLDIEPRLFYKVLGVEFRKLISYAISSVKGYGEKNRETAKKEEKRVRLTTVIRLPGKF